MDLYRLTDENVSECTFAHDLQLFSEFETSRQLSNDYRLSSISADQKKVNSIYMYMVIALPTFLITNQSIQC